MHSSWSPCYSPDVRNPWIHVFSALHVHVGCICPFLNPPDKLHSHRCLPPTERRSQLRGAEVPPHAAPPSGAVGAEPTLHCVHAVLQHPACLQCQQPSWAALHHVCITCSSQTLPGFRAKPALLQLGAAALIAREMNASDYLNTCYLNGTGLPRALVCSVCTIIAVYHSTPFFSCEIHESVGSDPIMAHR